MASPRTESYTATSGTAAVYGGRSSYPELTSITRTGTDIYAPTGTTKYPFTFVMHASGGGAGALDFGDKYQATLTGSLAYLTDTTLKWSARQISGGVTVYPQDVRFNPVASWNMETYHMGYTHGPATDEMYLMTERRYDQLLAWMDANVPQAHPTKRYASGGSMGAWGCMTFALRRPTKFAAIYPDRPRVRYSGGTNITVPDWESVSQVYNTSVSSPNVTAFDGGGTVAQHMDAVAYVANTANAIPWVGWCIGKNDGFSPFSDHIALVAAMRSAGRGFAFAWNNGDHSSGSIPSQITASYPLGLFELGKGYPVFSEHSLDGDPSTDLTGGINVGLTFRNVVETSGTWSCEVTHITSACTVKVKPKSSIYTGNPSPALVTIPAANTWVSVSF